MAYGPSKTTKKMSGKKKLAGMYGDKSKITRGDIITAAKKNKKKKLSEEKKKRKQKIEGYSMRSEKLGVCFLSAETNCEKKMMVFLSAEKK